MIHTHLIMSFRISWMKTAAVSSWILDTACMLPLLWGEEEYIITSIYLWALLSTMRKKTHSIMPYTHTISRSLLLSLISNGNVECYHIFSVQFPLLSTSLRACAELGGALPLHFSWHLWEQRECWVVFRLWPLSRRSTVHTRRRETCSLQVVATRQQPRLPLAKWPQSAESQQ